MGWFGRQYDRLMELWAQTGPGRCVYCREPIDRGAAVGGRFCSDQCATDHWVQVSS